MPKVATVLAVPSVNRTAPYRQIAEHYRSEIKSGVLQPGSVIPSITEVKDEWEVATSTAARALALLRDEGWIVTRPGKAAVVADRHPA